MILLNILYILTVFWSFYCSVGYIKSISSEVFSDYISVGKLLAMLTGTIILFLISIIPILNLFLIGRAYFEDEILTYKDSYLNKVLSYKLWSR